MKGQTANTAAHHSLCYVPGNPAAGPPDYQSLTDPRSPLVVILHPNVAITPQERLPPARVGQVPVKRCPQPCSEIARGDVSQLAIRLGVIDGVPPVMPQPVAHMRDQIDRP